MTPSPRALGSRRGGGEWAAPTRATPSPGGLHTTRPPLTLQEEWESVLALEHERAHEHAVIERAEAFQRHAPAGWDDLDGCLRLARRTLGRGMA